MRRLATLGALGAVLLTACGGTTYQSSAGQPVSMLLGVPPDTALHIAAQRLTAQGYTVSYASGQMLVTSPRAMPRPVRTASAGSPADSTLWVLVVTTESNRFVRGSRIQVMGYLVPPAATTPLSSGAPVQRQTIPITPESPQLYAEVQRVADWIRGGLPR